MNKIENIKEIIENSRNSLNFMSVNESGGENICTYNKKTTTTKNLIKRNTIKFI